MKSFYYLASAASLFGVSSAQWLPSCSWNNCMGNWNGWNCGSQSGLSCLCSNGTVLSEINSCIASACTNATDQQAIYGAIAQICVDNGVTVTNSEEATFSATSGGTLIPTITGAPHGWGPGGNWNSGAWSSWVSSCSSAWGGSHSGWPWSSGWPGHGGPWASGVPCDGPWTSWTSAWGPFSNWTGIWSGCSTTTASPQPATVTTTINGTAVVTTQPGVQAVAKSTSASGSSNAAASIISTPTVLGISMSFAIALFALMIGL